MKPKMETSHFSGSSNSDYGKKLAKLYKAVQSGNLTNVNEIVQNNLLLKKTALHAATSWGKYHIVENLVNSMTIEEIIFRDTDGYTALACAARTGIIQIAKCMIRRNNTLVSMPTKCGQIPVTLAVLNGHIKMVRYLYSVTPLKTLLPENGPYGAILLNQCFLSNNLDLALHLLKRCQRLAITPDEQGATLLWTLAGKPSVFLSGCKLFFWQRWIYNWIQIDLNSATEHIWIDDTESNAIETEKEIRIVFDSTTNFNDFTRSKRIQSVIDLLHQFIAYIFKLKCVCWLNLRNLRGIDRIYGFKLTHVLSAELLSLTCNEIDTLTDAKQLSKARVCDSLLRAAECGISEFITEVIKTKPNLLTVIDEDDGRNIFFKAVQFRQAKVFNLIYGYHSKNAVVSSRDKYDNTLLHMAAELAPSTQLNQISGAALQMQRELQWFKEVENIVQPVMREFKNQDHMTARELFTKTHKNLVEEGDKWMKQTAKSCTVVAVLIVTIMFAASLTVLGGNNQTKGHPTFEDHKYFKLFILADAISLFSFTTSLVLFLEIHISRCAEDDFLKYLPMKLIIGLSLLFISVAAMMISFVATISAMVPRRLWIIIPVIFFSAIPVTSFIWSLFPLLCEIYVSTYGSGLHQRKMKRWA